MTKENFLKLIERVKDGSASDQDILRYHRWFTKFQSIDEWNDSELGTPEDLKNLIEGRINEEINRRLPDKIVSPLWIRLVAAACIVLCLSFGGYYLMHKQSPGQTAYKSDVAPGRAQATLTLANGKKIILTNGLSGKLAQQGGTSIQMTSNNALTYISSAAIAANLPITYNTLSTAKGEQSPYPLILSDGTKIWLNAASSITFPTAFASKERMVEVKGEAYFEIAHNAAHPFKISLHGQVIEDIGTRFNINAYDNEPVITTTLIEGSVRVIKGTKTAIVKQGQQAITRYGNNSIVIENADQEEAMAWKNGLFMFKKADIYTVMRQLERWYNVDVVYEGKVPQRAFFGDIHRNLNASQVLDVLSYYKVHFKIDGKKIIVKE